MEIFGSRCVFEHNIYLKKTIIFLNYNIVIFMLEIIKQDLNFPIHAYLVTSIKQAARWRRLLKRHAEGDHQARQSAVQFASPIPLEPWVTMFPPG